MNIKTFESLSDTEIIRKMHKDVKLVSIIFDYCYSTEYTKDINAKALRIRHKYLRKDNPVNHIFIKDSARRKIPRNCTSEQLFEIMKNSKTIVSKVRAEIEKDELSIAAKVQYLEAYVKYLKYIYEITFHVPYDSVE